jgi:hypothetical protein
LPTVWFSSQSPAGAGTVGGAATTAGALLVAGAAAVFCRAVAVEWVPVGVTLWLTLGRGIGLADAVATRVRVGS